jgi:siroheme synthase
VTVFLVGAGPGDPGLITARGLELVRSCDVLVHDRLVADELVAEAPADAISIGRERLDQDEINRLLVLYGRRGLNVVRLKGGDPLPRRASRSRSFRASRRWAPCPPPRASPSPTAASPRR